MVRSCTVFFKPAWGGIPVSFGFSRESTEGGFDFFRCLLRFRSALRCHARCRPLRVGLLLVGQLLRLLAQNLGCDFHRRLRWFFGELVLQIHSINLLQPVRIKVSLNLAAGQVIQLL